MKTPRLRIDLSKIEVNARLLVDPLALRGVGVTGVTKVVLGSPEIAGAMLRGGVSGIGDARVENLRRLAASGSTAHRTLVRSPMMSQTHLVVRSAGTSLNVSWSVLEALDHAARETRRTHDVVLMVELGDLREGLAQRDVVDMALAVARLRRLRLRGLGANLACHSGVIPDDRNMGQLSMLAEKVESALGCSLRTVSGGNSANLGWAFGTSQIGRINDLRIGEAILLGTEPLTRSPLPGLHLDAIRLTAEVIEISTKPVSPWGGRAQAAFGMPDQVHSRLGAKHRRQAILGLGRQDVEPTDIVLPQGFQLLGMSSDHTIVQVDDADTRVGDEVELGLGYSSLLRAMTSPFVRKTWTPMRVDYSSRAGRRGQLRVEPASPSDRRLGAVRSPLASALE